MQHVVQNKNGSVTILKEFFEELIEKKDTIVDVTITIEMQNGQIHFPNLRLRRHQP